MPEVRVSMSQTLKVCTQWSLAPGLVSKKNLWLSEVILSVFFRGSWQKRNRAVWSASLTPPLGLCHPISHSVKRGGDGFIFECPGVRPATFNWEKSDRPLRPLSCPPVPPDQSLFSSVLVWTRYALHRDFKGKNKQTKKSHPIEDSELLPFPLTSPCSCLESSFPGTLNQICRVIQWWYGPRNSGGKYWINKRKRKKTKPISVSIPGVAGYPQSE